MFDVDAVTRKVPVRFVDAGLRMGGYGDVPGRVGLHACFESTQRMSRITIPFKSTTIPTGVPSQ